MDRKVAVAVLVVVVALAAAGIAYLRTQSGLNVEPVRQEFAWTFADRGLNRESGAPTTNVTLRIADVDIPLGAYVGSCFAVPGSAWPLLQNELTGAVCQWEGTGKEIGVFEENGQLVLKEGEVEGGTQEAPGSRDNFAPISR